MPHLLSRLLPCRTPAHIAAEQVGEFCRMALPILRDYTDLTAPAALDTVAPEPSFAMAIGVDDGLVTCKITVTYGDWSADLFSLGAPAVPLKSSALACRPATWWRSFALWTRRPCTSISKRAAWRLRSAMMRACSAC